MARCQQCNVVIVLGGRKKNGARYCSSNCMNQDQPVGKRPVSDAELEASLLAVHAGPCPLCEGDGPVDVHNVHRIWSALWFTQWKTESTVGCQSCGRSAQLRGILFSSLLGWWGFPWGFIVTPIQILRNLGGMLRSPSEYPSAQLEEMVRGQLAELPVSGPDDDRADGLDAGEQPVVSRQIEITCHSCGFDFGVETQMAGRTDHCPQCGIGLTIPEAVPNQLGPQADLATARGEKRGTSQAAAREREDAGWDAEWRHPWDDEWDNIDGRNAAKGRKPARRKSARPAAERKRPVRSLLTWIVVAVVSVFVLLGGIGFVLIEDNDRRNAAGHPRFDHPAMPADAGRPQPFPDHGMRLPEFRQPPPFPDQARPLPEFGRLRRQPGGLPPENRGDADVGDADVGDADVGAQQAVHFERLARQDKRTSAWYWKEAARVWIKLEHRDQALAAADKAESAAPENRSALLTHFWHRHLGDIFLELGEPERAIPHYEQALKTTDIPGYVAGVQKSLLRAVQQANR